MKLRAAVALLCAAGLPSAWAVPDLSRGIAAGLRGEFQLAEADLRPLAEAGYGDAQIALARLYERRPGEVALAEARRWYRAALANGYEVRLPLARLLLRTPSLTAAQEAKALIVAAPVEEQDKIARILLRLQRSNPELVPYEDAAALAAGFARSDDPEQRRDALAWYRATPDRPGHASAVLALCEQDREQIPDCQIELAAQARAAGQSEKLAQIVAEARAAYRAGTLEAALLERLARLLASTERPGARSPELAYTVLQVIDPPTPGVLARRAILLLETPTLDSAVDPLPLLETAAAQGDADAQFALGRLLLDPQREGADPTRAISLLSDAAATQPAAHFNLGRLYERGLNGRIVPDKALEHYLSAARAGQARADLALARMFSDNRGIKPNPVYALAFALSAELAQVPEADLLRLHLEGLAGAEGQVQARQLFEREQAARQAAQIAQAVAVDYPQFDAVAATEQPLQLRDPGPMPGSQALESRFVQAAAPAAPFVVETRATLGARADGDRSLGQGSGDDVQAAFINLYASALWTIDADWSAFGRVQGFAASDDLTVDDDNRPQPSRSFLALRELWVDYGGLTDLPGEFLRLGRQRLRQPDAGWVDRDIEALRWQFDSTLVQGWVAVAESLFDARSDQADVAADVRDRRYLLAGYARQWQPGHFWGLRFTHAEDHADPAQEIDSGRADPKRTERRFTWLGAYVHNDYFLPSGQPERNPVLAYWGSVDVLFGTRDDARVPGPGLSAVISRQDVHAYAVDLGVRWRLPTALPWQLGASYAYGSGSVDDSDTFEQTGLQSNRSRYSGLRSQQYRYNEALRAELSNLHVLTLSAALPFQRYEAGVSAHLFRRDSSGRVVTNGIDLQPVNASLDLGYGFDLVLAYYFDDSPIVTPDPDDLRANVRLRASSFHPGDAYAPGADTQYRLLLEWTLWF